MEDKRIEQPGLELQQLVDNIIEDEPSTVDFLGKKRAVGWFHKGTRRKFTHICMKERNEDKRNAKLCAVIILNGYFMLKLCYAFYWRWLYYIKDPTPVEVLKLLDASKKNSIHSVLVGYHIVDRDERPDDEHDEKGSASYPSRTSWGGAYSLAEKFPFLFERRFGIRAYDYWWGYTEAQIDLMAADQPIVVYHHDEDKPKYTKKKMDDFYDRWQAKKQDKSAVGEKISLSEYLRKK